MQLIGFANLFSSPPLHSYHYCEKPLSHKTPKSCANIKRSIYRETHGRKENQSTSLPTLKPLNPSTINPNFKL